MRCRFICDGDVWTKARGVRNLPSTLHSNVSPIAGIAIDGFVAGLGARIRAAGGGKLKESRGSNCSALSPQLQLALDSPLQRKPDWEKRNRLFSGEKILGDFVRSIREWG